ncbi:MAG TPA: heme o synthase [Methylomirabilota bacterium]
MSASRLESPAVPAPALPRVRSRVWADFLALTKPRVNLLVLVTAVIGFHLGQEGGTPLPLLFHMVVGTFLVASGAAVFNQVLERETDGRMRRTRQRPLPDGRIGMAEASLFAAALSAAGILQLGLGANWLAAGVAAVTLLSYALVYTPLKRVTSLATIIGAVPGALPPVIGWAAARNALTVEAWVLFAIVFFWQMPHVLALAWMFREDYERGGVRVLPVEEPDGRSTARQMVNYSAALVPVSLLPTVVGLTGQVYFAGALVLSLALLLLAVRFAREHSTVRVRQLFFASLGYLPVLWVLMLANRA